MIENNCIPNTNEADSKDKTDHKPHKWNWWQPHINETDFFLYNSYLLNVVTICIIKGLLATSLITELFPILLSIIN